MYTPFIIDFISVILLLGAFYLLWKERSRFYSLRPLLPALVLLAIAHICDMLVEHPSLRLPNVFALSPSTVEFLFTTISNIFDSVGIGVLIYGFIMIIKHEKAEEKHIKNLETLLPLCANCKKYRTTDGEWMPIERYLIDSGAPTLTHGLCPACMKLLYGDMSKTE
jgi:hypothetical protein